MSNKEQDLSEIINQKEDEKEEEDLSEIVKEKEDGLDFLNKAYQRRD